MIYLYAITDRSEAPLPAEMGLDGSPPFKVPHCGVAAIVSPFSKSQVPATEVNLWAHEAVVEALMADRAVLPLRFGTVLSSRAAVEGALEDHYCDFTASSGASARARGIGAADIVGG